MAGRAGLGRDRPDLRRDLAGRGRRAAGPQRHDRARHDAHQGPGAGRGRRRSIRTGSPRCSSTRWPSAAPRACSPRPARPCSASPGSGTRWPPTARSPARSGACTAAGARRTWSSAPPRWPPPRWCCPTDLELPGRHLRVRGAAGLHDRPRLGDRAALPRARARPRVPRSRCRSPIARRARCPCRRWSGRLASGAGWLALLVFHTGARYVGLAWLAGGLLLYVVYRKTQQKPLLRRVTIPERALRYEALEPEFGSILVPILGTHARRRHRPDGGPAGRRDP